MVIVIQLLVAVSCALLLNSSVDVFFMLLVSFDLDNALPFGFALSISKHLLAVLLDVLLHSAFRFHIGLELVGLLLNLALVHLVNISELHEFLKSLQVLVQTSKYSPEDVRGTVDLGIN